MLLFVQIHSEQFASMASSTEPGHTDAGELLTWGQKAFKSKNCSHFQISVSSKEKMTTYRNDLHNFNLF